MKPIQIFSTAAVILAILFAFLSSFNINEGESALMTRLGKIVSTEQGPVILKPGLHFKIPFIDNPRILDMRVQELETSLTSPLTVVTKEQTYLLVEYFAKWRISDLQKFYTSTGGSINWAETLLEQRINDIVRAEFGKYTSDQAISVDRANMTKIIRELANNLGREQGINVFDVRIVQITLPKDVMDSVFKRMATERKQFAEAKRAEGVAKSEEIKALADQRATIIKAQAIMQAAAIRAKGDQEAATLYAQVYGADPKFYSFFRSLEAYENSFNQRKDILILKPEGQFFNYFRGNNIVSKK